MTLRPASTLALGILSSFVLASLWGCTSMKCADCPGEPPDPSVIQLKLADGKLTVDLPEACAKNGGVIRWVLPPNGIFRFLPTWPPELPPLPILDCPAKSNYCDLKLPNLPPAPPQTKRCVFYTAKLSVDGKEYSLDPTFRILP